MKKCPFCAEKIKKDALVCKHCHKDLPAPPKKKSFLGKQKEFIEKAEEEEKVKLAHAETLPPKEKKAYLHEMEREKNVSVLWPLVIIVIIAFYLLFKSPWVTFAILFAAIWLHPGKGEDILQNRFKHLKKYKGRVAFILILLLFTLYRAFPAPQLHVLSSQAPSGPSGGIQA